MTKATGCEDTEPRFGPSRIEQRKLAHFPVFSDAQGEFSVFSQAVQSFTTACYPAPSERRSRDPRAEALTRESQELDTRSECALFRRVTMPP